MADSPQVWSGDRAVPVPLLKERSARLAAALVAAGVTHGERIAIVLRNEPAFLEVTMAAGAIGAVPVPVNWHWHGSDLRHLLENSAASVIFVHTDLLANVEGASDGSAKIVEVAVPQEVADAFGVERPELSGRYPDLESWIAQHEPHLDPVTQPPLGMIYTSGTTGLPKGILRQPTTPEQSKELGGLIFAVMGMAPGMRTLLPAPLYHTAPNTHALFALAGNMELILMSRFDPEEMLRLIERHRIEHIQMVPTMFVRLLGLPQEVRDKYDVSSLRAVVHAAAPCALEIKKAMIDWLGPIILEYYGGSESGVVVTCDTEQYLAHPGTVGKALGDADIAIFDDDGNKLGPDQTGEVYLRPFSCWPEFTYLGDDAKRQSIERDGYITVGDIGHQDADGFLYLSDRRNDMIISGGVNIYPAEIEACLIELAGVRDVAVFGIPDPDLGEAIAAHVDVRPGSGLTPESIRAHVGATLARYKMPKIVVLDDDLPREDSGKLFKRRIKEKYWPAKESVDSSATSGS